MSFNFLTPAEKNSGIFLTDTCTMPSDGDSTVSTATCSTGSLFSQKDFSVLCENPSSVTERVYNCFYGLILITSAM